MAKAAEFFSFGTNDLTQMTFGFSRDDVGTFMGDYLDTTAVGRLVEGLGEIRNFLYLCRRKKHHMKSAKRNIALVLTVLFCCYYLSISMFSHTHIVGGTTVVHSHIGGGSEHSHSESQYVVITLLSNFISEGAADNSNISVPYFLSSEPCCIRISFSDLEGIHASLSLRGPPQA